MTAIVLAGGKNSRIGTNKALLKLADRTVIEIILEKLSNLFSQIIITTNSPELYQHLGFPLVRDLYRGGGPLSGIHAGLLASNDIYNFVVGCDMPFIHHLLIKHLIAQRRGYDVVIPRVNGALEPLFAIYSKICIKPIEEVLTLKERRIISFYEKIKVKYIGREEVERFDPQYLSFFNINTWRDYEQAKKIALKITGRERRR